jgi:hypothetical protein
MCPPRAGADCLSENHGYWSLSLSRFRVCAVHLLPPTGIKGTRERSRVPQESIMSTTTLLIIVLVVLVLGGGGYYGQERWF